MRQAALMIPAALTVMSPALAAESAVPSSFDTAGHQTVLTLHGIGAQIYQCTLKADGSRAWALREPIAALVQDGKTVGRHFAGPNWDVGEGGISGKLLASAPGATSGDIPLLLLEVAGHHGGDGPLADASRVLRLNTAGGVLAGSCNETGALRSIPYQADYVFLK